jgi:Fe-S-cluster containining protein
MGEALAGKQAAAVPGGQCTACCSSSQFVHVEPDETEALAHFPPALLFPAPRMPAGHVLLGYDEGGRCPMLGARGCSIYQHRPRTCRTYDCRIFSATGIELEDDDKALSAERVGRWQFDVCDAADERARHALRAAAPFVGDHEDLLSDRPSPSRPEQRAVLAVLITEALLGHDPESSEVAEPDIGAVRLILAAR